MLSTSYRTWREAEAEVAAFLEACPESFAQATPAWARVIEHVGPDRSGYLACHDGARLVGMLPAHLCDGPLGAILVSAAQAGALGGVAVASEVERAPVYAALLGAFREHARERGAALATVYTNPLWPDDELCERFLEPHYVLDNTCQVLDLARGVAADGSFPLASESHQRNVRRAESGALRVTRETEPEAVRAWHRIHVERHGAIGARPLPEALFLGALAHAVPAGKASFFLVRLADDPAELVAGGFYLHHAGTLDALMPAFRAEHAELAPNFALAAHTLRWARAQGLRHYNWQGSPPEGGVRRFKLQWGSTDRAYRLCTRVTGDATRFTRASADELKRGYAWHFALPFDALGSTPGAAPIRSARAGAWKAAEAPSKRGGEERGGP
jgi:hypothetical protein